MEKEFCTYEQALALKELGFDEPCFGYYVGLGDSKEDPFKLVQIQSEKEQFQWTDNVYHAPLYQQAFRWFREKHNLDCNVATYALNRPKEYHWIISWTNEAKGHGLSKTYEEAESACLDKLIETCKTK